MKRKPISEYCQQEVAGWYAIPELTMTIFPGEEEFSCVFFRESDAIQFLATVKDHNGLRVIHASLAPIRSVRKDWTDEEHNGHIFDVAFEVLKSFFPGRKFLRQPDDPRRPQVKHYFSILKANE